MLENKGTGSLKKKAESYPRTRHDKLEVERGSYLKKWKGKCPVALLYPNTYAVGMSSLGFQLVYSLLGERDDVVCERFFLPERNEPFVSIESGRPLHDFPFLFFSVSFEQDYLNLIKLLLLGNIVPYAQARADKADSPLVVCGGVAAFINPEPIASFIDLFVVGEAEPLLDDLVDHLLQMPPAETRKAHLREAAQKLKGIYAPCLYTPYYDNTDNYAGVRVEPGAPEQIMRVSLATCKRAPHSELLTPAAEFSNLYLTELGRGCSRGCRFCAAGFIYRPPRLWDADAVVQGLNDRAVDVRRVGLLGMEMAEDNTLDHISTYLMESGCALSFSSLRADRINDKLLALLQKSALKSVAIAPDGTSERLRSVINKGLKEADLLRGAERLVEAGIYKLKVYVMVGLPTETCEDLQEFIDLVGRIKETIDEIGKKRGRLTEMFLSVNCFIPKPWTPFQYHPFGMSIPMHNNASPTLKDALENLKGKIAYLKKGVKSYANVHFQADKPENALFQALLAKGDRRIGDVLYDMATRNLSWKNAMRKNDLSAEQYILREADADTCFPWYIIDHGIKHEYFWREYVKGINASPTEPCDPSICRRCGVCSEI